MMAAKTVLEVLNATTDFFKKRGVESARLNAEHLIAHALRKKNRIELYLEFERALSENELEPLREFVKRRAAGEPLQHLLGTIEFHGRTFLCDKRALIPRPETEQLVEKVLALKSQISNPQCLDMGTGSGVIALTLAAELPEATIHAADVAEEALALARENAQRLDLSKRVAFFQSDLFASVPVDALYDLIVANLPYIATETIPTLTREVRHDPESALDGGTEGTEIMRQFAQDATKHLKPGGMIALEIGADQNAVLSEHLHALGYQQIRCEPDHQGFGRFLFAVYG